MTWRSGFVVASSLLWAVLLPGCSEDTAPTISAPVWGIISGPDGPAEATIFATGDAGFVRVDTDELGRYELPLPVGKYNVSIGLRSAPVELRLHSDWHFRPRAAGEVPPAIEIFPDTGPIRVDVRLSNVDVTIEGLQDWSDTVMNGRLGRVGYATGEVSRDHLTLHFGFVPEGDYPLILDERVYAPGVTTESEAMLFHVGDGQQEAYGIAMNPPIRVRGMLVDPFGFTTELICRTSIDDRVFSVELDNLGRFETLMWSDTVALAIRARSGEFGLSTAADGRSEPFPLTPGQTIDLPPLTVPGVSIEPTGVAPADAEFWIRNPADERWSNAYSPFVLGPLPVGRYEVGVDARTPCRTVWVPTHCDEGGCDGIPLEISLVAPNPTVELPLIEGARIEGYVTSLERRPDLVGSLLAADTTLCDAEILSYHDGYFGFRGLRPGAYLLRFASRDTVFWYPGVSSEEEAEILEVDQGNARWLEMPWPDVR
ncbi:MAG: hypothetical protein KC729_08635 [Candidatus Eisenbacteria bacterium]|uniref:Carboxypeptidase regulatory-like domain-containing protein n=1 Tax=Eiseniibacteriota bacterium TaxID=2212470 RepID=A0A956RPU0_UNCEI|nr:hypothetical protein [Candidatus Eisenbacteria bacterium]